MKPLVETGWRVSRASNAGRFAVCVLLAGFVLGLTRCARKDECYRDTDCPGGFHCDDGFCRSECTFDVDCPPGQVCLNARGYCVVPDGGLLPDSSTAGDGGADGSAGSDSGPGPDGQSPPDGALPDGGQPDGAPSPGIYTDPCANPSDCQSQQCLDDLRSTQDFCSAQCAADSNCILGHVCEFIGGTKYCQDSDMGASCSGAGQCVDECIGNSVTGVGHCTRPCSTAADCPAGYACTNLGNQDYCVNISMYCTNGTTDCITGLCLNPYGYNACTAYCVGSADCPVDYICDTDGVDWYCVPPTFGMGGLGDPCTSNCQSGLCMGSYCTVKCGVTRSTGQYCPPGYGCSPAQNGPQYELVCTTAGTGGFGLACSNNNQCATSACMEMSDLSMECSRFCNDGVSCPSGYSCQPLGIVASGVSLSVCFR